MSSVNFTGQNVEEFTITGFDHLSHQKLLGFLIFITYFLVLLGSGTNICIIVSDRRLHTPMYLLVCNLAVVDIMFTTSSSTTMISVLLAEVKTISYYSCISRMYIYHLGDIEECLALSLMALDRTIAISTPLRYHSILTNPRLLLLIIATWLIGLGVMGLVAAQADSLPYCQPIIRYVFCDYPSMVRAACVNPEPYWMLPTILGLWLIGAQLTFILLSYVNLIYTVLRLPNNESRVQACHTQVRWPTGDILLQIHHGGCRYNSGGGLRASTTRWVFSPTDITRLLKRDSWIQSVVRPDYLRARRNH
ncbi:hypothetical protein J4Q44_G00245260 [Coregonus suidteri]|uniref:G-protein coupled receptors family 1 profile domain-containing protein n=1 Tax=Coregonus suidteri TaxID=861788 RepID=A0AAN8LQ86_9TELE